MCIRDSYVAADLLSQAEHDEMASAILITTSTELAQNVEKEIEGYLKVLSDVYKRQGQKCSPSPRESY